MRKLLYGFLALAAIVMSGWLLSNAVLAIVYPTDSNENEIIEEDLEKAENGSEGNENESERAPEQFQNSEEKIVLRSGSSAGESYTRSQLLDWRDSVPWAYGAVQVFFDEVEYDLGIDGTTSDEELLKVIHHMSHQKVRAEHKVGHIPLTRDTVNQLREAVYEKEDSNHEGLLRDIADYWYEEDWAIIHDEHNAVWQYDRDENIGAAYNVASSKEEMDYIVEHFSDLFEELKN